MKIFFFLESCNSTSQYFLMFPTKTFEFLWVGGRGEFTPLYSLSLSLNRNGPFKSLFPNYQITKK